MASRPGIGVEDTTGLGLVLAPARLGAEGEGTEGELRDTQTTPAEQLVLHGSSSADFTGRDYHRNFVPQLRPAIPRTGDNPPVMDERDEEFMRVALSEAAAAVCLESGTHGPGAGVQDSSVQIQRFALGADATHLTGGDPEGTTLRHLLAGVIGSEALDLVHAHGTGTLANDPVELAAIESVVSTSAPIPWRPSPPCAVPR